MQSDTFARLIEDDAFRDAMNSESFRAAMNSDAFRDAMNSDAFRGAMNSFAVAAKTNRATSLMRRYGIRAVPKLVVDGRYRFERGLSYKDMTVLAEQLADEIRRERQEDVQ